MSQLDDGTLHRSLPALRKLQPATVWVDNTHITAQGLSEICQLSSVNYLGVSRTDIKDIDLAMLVGLRKLERVRVGHSVLTQTGVEMLGKLPHLRRLCLVGAEITDAEAQRLRSLSASKTLDSIDLGHTSVTDRGLADLQQALPNVKLSKWP